MAAETRFDPLTVSIFKPRGRRWMRRLALAFIFLFVAAAAMYGVWRYRASEARDAAIAKIQAAGEPVWFADLRPKPLDPAVDGTPLLLQAFEAMTPLPDDIVDEMRELTEPSKESLETDDHGALAEEFADELPEGEVPPERAIDEEMPLGGAPQDEIPLDEVPAKREPPPTFEVRERRLVAQLRPLVDANGEAFSLVDQALAKGHIRFPVDYDSPMPLLREDSEGGSYMELAQLLKARWRIQLHDEDIAAATATLERMQRCAAFMIAMNKSTIASVYSTYGVANCVESLEETISRSGTAIPLTPNTDMLLAQLEATFRLRPALIGERAEMLTVIENMLEHGNDGEPLVGSKIVRAVIRPMVWSNQAAYLEGMATRIEFADRYDMEAEQERDDLDAYEESVSKNPFDKVLGFSRLLLPVYDFNGHVRDTRDRLRGARVAIQVDAFRRQHGRLPKALDEIEGQGFPRIPTDLASEKPLAYIVDIDAFAICPASEVELETKRLAKRVAQRDADPEKAEPEAAEDINGFFPEPQDEPEEDDDARTSAFRVVYPRPTVANAGDGNKHE